MQAHGLPELEAIGKGDVRGMIHEPLFKLRHGNLRQFFQVNGKRFDAR